MKQLHFTGKSKWENGKLITTLHADFGYMLLYSGYDKETTSLIIASDNYEEQQKTISNKIAVVRNWVRGSNKEVQLSDAKKMKEWTKVHGYDTIEL